MLAAGAVLYAQPQPHELIERASHYPPEFAADAILRLAEASRQPAAWKRERVQAAFDLAWAARQPMRRTEARAAGEPRSLEAFAGDQRLDSLTLQSRAVAAMLGLDRVEARRMFERMPLAPFAAMTCQDRAAADPSAYYEALAAVLERGFTDEERRRGGAAQMLLAAAGAISSPLQLAPMARVLTRRAWSDAEMQAAAAGYSQALARMDPADVAFTVALARDDLDGALRELASLLESRGIAAADLAGNARRFSAGVPCAAPVAEKRHRADAERVAQRLRRLRITARGTREFSEQAQEAAEEISRWDPSGASSTEAFHRRAGLWEALVEVLPAGEERMAALARYAAFVAGAGVREEAPVGWFCHAQALAGRLQQAGAARLLGELESVGNGLLAFAKAVEEAAPARNPYCPPQGVCMALTGPDAMRAELLAFLLN
jgi:hypothetical protein